MLFLVYYFKNVVLQLVVLKMLVMCLLVICVVCSAGRDRDNRSVGGSACVGEWAGRCGRWARRRRWRAERGGGRGERRVRGPRPRARLRARPRRRRRRAPRPPAARAPSAQPARVRTHIPLYPPFKPKSAICFKFNANILNQSFKFIEVGI